MRGENLPDRKAGAAARWGQANLPEAITDSEAGLAAFDAESQDIYVRGVLALIPSHWLVTYRSGLVSALRAAATALEAADVQ